MTLGCKVNQYDTAAMEEILQREGFETVDFSEKADLYVVNTCTVTNIADRKSRQMIHRARQMNPKAKICVAGCLAQRDAEAILQMEGVSAVIGAKDRAEIGRIVQQIFAEEGQVNAVGSIRKERSFEPLTISKSDEKIRANVKICEGCENFCSYCIIPFARGPVRSRPLEDILAEGDRLAKSGVKEVVLTGIHIGSYGKDWDYQRRLIDVIEAMEQVEGLERIRLGSLEPSMITEEFCARAKKGGKLCPHFHLSLQSGSATVLQRMNRRYTPEEYAMAVERLRHSFENPAITTDVICGFPQETEEEHRETLAFLRRIGFAKVHVFPYSQREGTRAAAMSGQVPMAIRKARAAEVAQIGAETAQRYLEGFVGKRELVLLEELLPDGRAVGHNERYCMVKGRGLPNTMVTIEIGGVEEGALIEKTARRYRFMEDCIFCKIARGDIPSKKVYEDETVLAFHDIDGKAPVHVLVIPKKHIQNIISFEEEDRALQNHLLDVIKKVAEEMGVSETGFRVVANTGADGGQTVNHLHFHILGGRSLQWPPG